MAGSLGARNGAAERGEGWRVWVWEMDVFGCCGEGNGCGKKKNLKAGESGDGEAGGEGKVSPVAGWKNQNPGGSVWFVFGKNHVNNAIHLHYLNSFFYVLILLIFFLKKPF